MKGRLIATTKTFSIVSLPNWRIFTIHFGTREKRHRSFARWGNKRKRHGCYGSIAMNFPASAPFREHPHKKSLPNPCNSRKYFLSLPRQNRQHRSVRHFVTQARHPHQQHHPHRAGSHGTARQSLHPGPAI